MYRETVPSRQLGAWIAAALCPVAVQLAASKAWSVVAVTAAVCAMACWAVWRWGRFGRWTAIPAYLLLIVFMGQLLKESSAVWKGNSYPAVPLMLLALALWSAWKGASAAARVGCVLFWVVLIVYPVVFGAALQDVRWKWAMQGGRDLDFLLASLLLLPALGKLLLRKDQRPGRRLLLPGIFAVIGSLLTRGILSGQTEGGFYQMVRSIDLLGVVKHFDALVSAGATLGWFALLSYCLTICAGAGETVSGAGRTTAVMGAAAAAVWMLCDMHIAAGDLLLLAAVSWVVLPLLAQGIESVKKKRKCQIDP